MAKKSRRFGWNSFITIPCTKEDKKKLQIEYLKWKEKTGIYLSFVTWISIILIPESIKRINNNKENKQRKDFV